MNSAPPPRSCKNFLQFSTVSENMLKFLCAYFQKSGIELSFHPSAQQELNFGVLQSIPFSRKFQLFPSSRILIPRRDVAFPGRSTGPTRPAKPLLFYRFFCFLILLVINDFCFVYVLLIRNFSLWTVFLAF